MLNAIAIKLGKRAHIHKCGMGQGKERRGFLFDQNLVGEKLASGKRKGKRDPIAVALSHFIFQISSSTHSDRFWWRKSHLT